MRRHHQRQVLELLKTIEEAQAAGLYADCQQGALTAGEFIETFEGEGTATVALLEDYCELLYKASIGGLGDKPDKTLRKHFIKIENSVKNELKQTRLEVVFLSYKASMSDSLESIYFAAKDDPDCDAIWIPVPYFDRFPDLSFGEMHLEGPECYEASGIECTNWQEYDIEARRPDIIFTFAPYDELNFVTSVHPLFYCERLRKQTDLLVYVPYFVWGDEGHVPEPFCANGGCMYAHKVVVQSERVRKDYIKIYRQRIGSSLGSPEDKFLALGSPKFDKVTHSGREDFELPEEWERLLRHCGPDPQSPAGMQPPRKKAVFYNTTVAAIVNSSGYYIEKIRTVFDAFKNRDDVVLWWRPHPLSMSTYASMRPGLHEEYMKLVDDYKRGGIGIYDDSTDLHRAIAWTDAYLGDFSSVLTMYKATGKPCMVQCLDEYFFDYIRISAETGDAVWCCAHRYNALFRIDKETLDFEFAGSFPGDPLDEVALYVCGAAYGGKIYFSPYRADKIAVYDTASGTFTFIPVRDGLSLLTSPEMDFHYGCKFLKVHVYGDYVFFSPAGYPAVVRLDCRTNKLDYFDDFVPKLPQDYKKPPQNAVYMFGESDVYGSKIIIPVRSGNALVFFDMETCTSEVVREITDGLPDGTIASGVAFDGKNCWILYPNLKRVVCWDLSERAPETVYSEINDGTTEFPVTPMVMSYACGYIWISSPKISLKIDVRTKKYTQAYELLCGSVDPGDGFAVAVTGDDAGRLRYVTSNGKYRECAAGGKKPAKTVNLADNADMAVLRAQLLKQAAETILPGRGTLYEQPLLDAEAFIGAAADGSLAALPSGSNSTAISADKPAGTVIYNAMKKLCEASIT